MLVINKELLKEMDSYAAEHRGGPPRMKLPSEAIEIIKIGTKKGIGTRIIARFLATKGIKVGKNTVRRYINDLRNTNTKT